LSRALTAVSRRLHQDIVNTWGAFAAFCAANASLDMLRLKTVTDYQP